MSHVEESVELTLGQKRRLVARLLREKAGLKRGGPGLVHRLIEVQAARTPEAVAVTCSRGSLTYSELNAGRTAWLDVFATWASAPRCWLACALVVLTTMVVGLLAVLKAGGATCRSTRPIPPSGSHSCSTTRVCRSC